ncbi:splicing factor 3A subunit 3 [Moelleriella libera RCEF 2490]|uniref:Splicing factor 3A subunit 3 n=1 Tax=Moelleriella libera RCEF 2490 TaxID=1081109 RepID=A0A166PKQ9_9HYPO|nr:splicing factor 3A subunit 3 [Moelleriella libera RCEF 2490]
MFILEEQRHIHEDLERLEQGVADRVREEPKHIRDRLNRDHEISQLLDQIQTQSSNLLNLYKDDIGSRAAELQQLGNGDPFDTFYKQLSEIREHHARYPNEQAENSEQRYRQKVPGDASGPIATTVDTIFSGEEAFGRFFDLNTCYESYLNLPNVKRHTYLQYLEHFDNFAPAYCGVKRVDKLTDQYFAYVGELAQYLEDFMRRTRPLENIDKVLNSFDVEFSSLWEKDGIDGWQAEPQVNGAEGGVSGAEAKWCKHCEKEFKNENVYDSHLTGRKHKKAEELWQQRRQNSDIDSSKSRPNVLSATRLKERAVAEREFRIKRLSSAMSTERSDTRVNVERKQGMTKREREQELENILTMSDAPRTVEDGEGDDDDDDEKIYNPLKVPLGWDGKPIPFWLYRLHGLGNEFECEICGNYVYKGRRAFEKHFNEARHIYNLKCLGITNPTLFRDITSMDEAQRLWDKIQREKKQSKLDEGSIVQMEDGEGNVMPEKVYYDLQKQGLL